MKKVITFVALCMLFFIDESLARPKAVFDGLLGGAGGGLGDPVGGLGGGFSEVGGLGDPVGGLPSGLPGGAGVGPLGDTVSGFSGGLPGRHEDVRLVIELIAQLLGISDQY